MEITDADLKTLYEILLWGQIETGPEEKVFELVLDEMHRRGLES